MSDGNNYYGNDYDKGYWACDKAIKAGRSSDWPESASGAFIDGWEQRLEEYDEESEEA